MWEQQQLDMPTQLSTELVINEYCWHPWKGFTKCWSEIVHDKITYILTLFSCSIYAIYSIVSCAKKQRLMLKSYLPGINTLVFPKIHYENIVSEKLVNELHAWIENHPHLIHPPNVSYSLFIKINGTLVNKQKHILQI